MKREDVTGIFEGATDEQINALLDINSRDIGSAKHRLEAERDNYKEQLTAAQTALEGFKGVNVEELNGKIAQLTSDLDAREKEYRGKIEEMEFTAELDRVLGESKARNGKAVTALLDLDALRSSKNRGEDIRAAVAKLRESDDYLFESDEPVKNPVAPTNNPHLGAKKMSLAEAMKYKNEHPDADIKSLI